MIISRELPEYGVVKVRPAKSAAIHFLDGSELVFSRFEDSKEYCCLTYTSEINNAGQEITLAGEFMKKMVDDIGIMPLADGDTEFLTDDSERAAIMDAIGMIEDEADTETK